MRVVLVNHSDTRGGASVVTLRLMHALRRAGVDARMLVMHKATGDSDIALVGNALTRKAAFLAEHAEIFLRNGLSRADLFKASIATCGQSLHDHPWVADADVVVLGWINQGMLSLAEIARIKAPVVWTMHDMWCLTGVCHHAGECISYMRQCGNCRLMHGGTSADDLSRSTHERKQRLYDRKPIHFVAVSNWLAHKCTLSSLMRDRNVTVIPNAFPVEDFYIEPRLSRAASGLPTDGPLIVMGAARLDDPIKGLDMAVDALNMLRDLRATAVFFGALRDRHVLDTLKIPYVWLGPVNDPDRIKEIYAHASCVLSTSHYETLPGTLIEGMAAGCVPVTYGYGGQPDIVDHLRTGYIAQYHKADDVAAGIRYALSGKIAPQTLRDTVARRFAADSVAQRYIELFDSLIAGNTPGQNH